MQQSNRHVMSLTWFDMVSHGVAIVLINDDKEKRNPISFSVLILARIQNLLMFNFYRLNKNSVYDKLHSRIYKKN